MSSYGERLDLPVEGQADSICPHTGDLYRLQGDTVTLVAADLDKL